MECGSYLILMIKVRPDRLLAGALREIGSLGSRIEYVDEEERRIVANTPSGKLNKLIEIVSRYAEYASVEVKASCRHADRDKLRSPLRSLGFKLVNRAPSTVLSGLYKGRATLIEVRGDKLWIKVGRTTSSTPKPPIPMGIYTIDVSEAGDALAALYSLIEVLRRSLQNE